ncbi:MAG: G-D-S-L family lipolytic protein [Bacteroidetes bacterium]|nr:MAG: G-D-S-L family lipolytic protein [Bacteroidota bacterium]
MKSIKFAKIITLIIGFCAFGFLAHSQQKPAFWDDIRSFKKSDSISPVPKHEILFVGSSSFTKWTDVQSYFPSYPIINRGFGGSTLLDVIRYAPDIIYPYDPKQVVIYCGDNDLASSDTISAATVYSRFIELFQMIRKHLPSANIVYVAIKPSPSRVKLMPKAKEANSKIKEFLSKQPKTGFVDVFSLMLDASGKPIEDIFIEDKLHMNAKGYAIWQKAIEPYLLKK